MLQKLLTSLMLCFVVIMHPLQAFAQQTQSPPVPQPPQGYYWPAPWHMWGDGYGWHFWWMFPLMMLFMMLVCGAFIYLLLSRHSGGSHQWGPMDRQWNTGYSALEILDERYARGEIQKEEYQDRKAAILSGRLR